MQEKLDKATKNILEKNLKILEKPFCENKVVLVYDEDSKLSKILWESYAKNLLNLNKNAEIINFWKISKENLKEKLINLKEKLEKIKSYENGEIFVRELNPWIT